MNTTGLGVASSMPMEMGAIGRLHRGAQSDIKFAEISAAATGHSVSVVIFISISIFLSAENMRSNFILSFSNDSVMGGDIA